MDSIYFPVFPDFLLPLLPPEGTKQITISAPDKTKRTVAVGQLPLLYDGADQVGLYTASSDKPEWRRTFAVSLLNKSESDLEPGDALKIGESKAIESENKARANRELWGYLMIAALTILGIEWWVFHRGV